jgi:2-succinyl-5-enolpyruvyl-6-hydroxy-3-cyclohexene-1-carboxylate synthase
MKRDQAVLNRIWGRVILEELARLGVMDVCIAPGSRSTPLVLEADANPNLTLHTHFDERGLGYLALGMAKASQRPVVIVVTSGTAAANLFPAICEANLTGEKLIVLTADRPVELINCGANQAIDQVDLYSHQVTQAISLPAPTIAIPLNWLLTTVDNAVAKQVQFGGVIHFNCPYREPLYSDLTSDIYADYLASIDGWTNSDQAYTVYHLPAKAQIGNLPQLHDRKGLIILGSLSLVEAQKGLQLGQELGWPVLCDPQSGVSSDWAYFDIWLQNSKLSNVLSECDVIIQFGSRLVSKWLTQWLKIQITKRNAEYHYIAPSLARDNPSHRPQQHYLSTATDWVDAYLSRHLSEDVLYSGWADSIKSSVLQIPTIVKYVTEVESLSEVSLAAMASEHHENSVLFLGNSLIVRLVDMFAALDHVEVFSNRGASGIDGLLATAVGVHSLLQQPMLAIMGDTSLLYDLNSLALLTHISIPFVVVVTNNNGGAIFDLLPVPTEQKAALYQLPHGLEFEHAAQQFNLNYVKPNSIDEYRVVLNQHLAYGKGALVIEVCTPSEQASRHIKQIVSATNAL